MKAQLLRLIHALVDSNSATRSLSLQVVQALVDSSEDTATDTATANSRLCAATDTETGDDRQCHSK